MGRTATTALLTGDRLDRPEWLDWLDPEPSAENVARGLVGPGPSGGTVQGNRG
ncbi:hypothetical protein GCM10010521_70990 [Streptomyces rameus]|uniref:Uncharacterized protein n=1 Tax=Streptomyces rameus TaxID=68261 RepID=A0ABP6HPM0_9ACTN